MNTLENLPVVQPGINNFKKDNKAAKNVYYKYDNNKSLKKIRNVIIQYSESAHFCTPSEKYPSCGTIPFNKVSISAALGLR